MSDPKKIKLDKTPAFRLIALSVAVLFVGIFIGGKQYLSPPDLNPGPEMAAAARSFRLNRSLYNKDLYKRIQTTWLADQQPENLTYSTKASLRRWYNNPSDGGDMDTAKAFDRHCQSEFSPALEAIFPDKLKLPPFVSWTEERQSPRDLCTPFLTEVTPEDPKSAENVETASFNALSIILLLDQLSRNIFRQDQKLIYSHYDRLSQSLLHTILSAEPRLDLAPSIRHNPVKRTWFYMPLMHSESLEDHILFNQIFREMRAEMQQKGDDKAVESLDRTLGFEEDHIDIIQKFGRYPYRNQVMERETTAEEEKWLEDGKTFGTKL